MVYINYRNGPGCCAVIDSNVDKTAIGQKITDTNGTDTMTEDKVRSDNSVTSMTKLPNRAELQLQDIKKKTFSLQRRCQANNTKIDIIRHVCTISKRTHALVSMCLSGNMRHFIILLDNMNN